MQKPYYHSFVWYINPIIDLSDIKTILLFHCLILRPIFLFIGKMKQPYPYFIFVCYKRPNIYTFDTETKIVFIWRYKKQCVCVFVRVPFYVGELDT